MPRKRPEGRLDELVAAAARVFEQRGLRRAQMADIARELGASAGSLYAYVESKEALFDLVIQRAFLSEPPPEPELPLATPPREQLLAHVRDRLAQERTPRLEAAIAAPVPDGGAGEEVDEILRELYDFLAAHRRGVRLIERAAHDRPDLAAVYFECGRAALVDRIARYLGSRIAAQRLRSVPDLRVAARLVLETTSWFAIHRHYDFQDMIYDDATARETVVAMLRASLEEELPK